MAQEFGLHVSTVAFSVYNWLAVRPTPATKAEILRGLQASWDRLCTGRAVEEALIELVARKRITEASGHFAVRDPRRRIAVSRSRDDDPWAWQVTEQPRRSVSRQPENLDDVLSAVAQ